MCIFCGGASAVRASGLGRRLAAPHPADYDSQTRRRVPRPACGFKPVLRTCPTAVLRVPGMKVYDAPNIRNVVVVGHGGCGKTQLVSAMLFASGAVNRLGKVDDGSTVT